MTHTHRGLLGLLAILQASSVGAQLPGDISNALTIPPGSRVVLRLTEALSSDSKEEPTGASLVTVHDIVVRDDVVLIPRGSRASFSVIRKGARRLSRPGQLELRVEGIYTVTGQVVVPLSATERRVGEAACADSAGCALGFMLFFWLKGENPSWPAGTLVTATVDRPVSLDEDSVRRFVSGLSRQQAVGPPAGAKLHIYTTGLSSIEVRLDGTRGGSLGSQQYGCVGVSPGSHVIRVANRDVAIAALPGREYFVHWDGTSLTQVAGYRFDGVLEPSTTLKNQIQC